MAVTPDQDLEGCHISNSYTNRIAQQMILPSSQGTYLLLQIRTIAYFTTGRGGLYHAELNTEILITKT